MRHRRFGEGVERAPAGLAAEPRQSARAPHSLGPPPAHGRSPPTRPDGGCASPKRAFALACGPASRPLPSNVKSAATASRRCLSLSRVIPESHTEKSSVCIESTPRLPHPA
jgi:hypothetical protein